MMAARADSHDMWNGKRVSVILPTFNEKDSIRESVLGHFATGWVDEVIVVNNNAAPGTSEAVQGTGAIEVREPRQGYGWACRRGLEIATGDLIIISEPDGTFEPRDVVKLLAYSEDCDYVLGTRTTREFIWAGANMGLFLKWGNWAVAKWMELLFNCSILTDVGCTLRLISREALERVRGAFTVGGSHFGPQLTLLAISAGIRFTEISVNYRPRVGTSSVTGSFRKAFALGLRMIGMITGFRVRTWLARSAPPGVIPAPLAIPREKAARVRVREREPEPVA
jgi:glycosyltransferase involved in cell wall biosynthesis